MDAPRREIDPSRYYFFSSGKKTEAEKQYRSPLCETIPKDVEIIVGRNAGGLLNCPLDEVGADEEDGFDPRKDCFHHGKWKSNSGKSGKSCSIFSLKRGCELVDERMKQLEKSEPQCNFGNIRVSA